MMKITKAESYLIRDKVAERLKDLVYLKANDYVWEMMKSTNLDKSIDGCDTATYTFNFKVEMVAGDFWQILARVRRDKSDKTTRLLD